MIANERVNYSAVRSPSPWLNRPCCSALCAGSVGLRMPHHFHPFDRLRTLSPWSRSCSLLRCRMAICNICAIKSEGYAPSVSRNPASVH